MQIEILLFQVVDIIFSTLLCFLHFERINVELVLISVSQRSEKGLRVKSIKQSHIHT